jgi:hypothetical protein
MTDQKTNPQFSHRPALATINGAIALKSHGDHG